MAGTLKRKKRRQKPKKRFDLTNLCKTLEDLGFVRGSFSCLGIVQAAEDGGTHFDLDDEDLTVEVELMPSQTKLTVRVAGTRVWDVPAIGEEVLVCIPDGDIDFQPVIVNRYSSGSLPDGISASTLVINAPSGGEIYAHDGAGTVEPLIKKSEYDALKAYIDAHVHPTAMGPSGPPAAPAPAAPGTTVLKGK